MNQLDLLRIAGRFRDLLGHLNTIDWSQFRQYHLAWSNSSATREKLPAFDQFRTELKDTIGHLPAGNRLVRAFEDLAVDSEDQWGPAKTKAWGRFHEFCDYMDILRDHAGTPVFDATPEVAIVPSNKIQDFDFSVSCDVDFEPFPEGSASFHKQMRRGNCRDCQRPLTVSATDESVLKRVYRQCIAKVKRGRQSQTSGWTGSLVAGVASDTSKTGERKLSSAQKRMEADSHIIDILRNWHVKNGKVVEDAPIGLQECARRLKERFSAGTRYQVERFFREQFPRGRANKDHSLYVEICGHRNSAQLLKLLNNLDATDLALQSTTGNAVASTKTNADHNVAKTSKCDHCDNVISAAEADEWGVCELHRHLPGTV